MRRRACLGAPALLLGACASAPRGAGEAEAGWQAFTLPGKTPSRYHAVHKAGRPAVEARADDAASLWRRRLRVPAAELGRVQFSWWADALLPEASLAEREHEDAVARVLFGFDGDAQRLAPRTRAQFELMALLTGEAPPFATLMYAWDTRAPVGSLVPNPRTDRVRTWVLDSGAEGLGQWRDHERDLRADFERAFGEPPGDLVSVAFMTDSDNTDGRARAWYGPLRLGPRTL